MASYCHLQLEYSRPFQSAAEQYFDDILLMPPAVYCHKIYFAYEYPHPFRSAAELYSHNLLLMLPAVQCHKFHLQHEYPHPFRLAAELCSHDLELMLVQCIAIIFTLRMYIRTLFDQQLNYVLMTSI